MGELDILANNVYEEMKRPEVWEVVMQIDAKNRKVPTFDARNFFCRFQYVKLAFRQQGNRKYAKPKGL